MIPLSRPNIGDAEIDAVRRVMQSGRLAAGPQVEAFEDEFATEIGVGRAVAVANGTTALELSLRALGIGPGDEVIVPSFTFIATANAVAVVGATPVFADIDPKSFCLSAETVAPLVGGRTAAVIVVHLYGQAAPVGELRSLCDEHGLALIEDAAQAFGATSEGRQVGGLGTIGTFSFYPTKTITTGEGGMVTTGDPALADRVALLGNHGMRQRYHHEIVGTNARMTEMAAAIGRVQLTRHGRWTEQRRLHARRYDAELTTVETPHVLAGTEHAYHLYTVRTPDRAAMTAALERAGVGHGVYYEVPCHRQGPYEGSSLHLPHTDEAAVEVVSIPVRADLTEAELDHVIGTINGTAA